jgi:hypothetical protein
MFLKKWNRRRLIGNGIGLLVGLCLFLPYIFEPTDAPKFLDVKVVSYRTGWRGLEYFTVVSPSGQSWEVGAARGPFPPEYRGSAVLSISHGRWTNHARLRLLIARHE